jgi:hypothetical protein
MKAIITKIETNPILVELPPTPTAWPRYSPTGKLEVILELRAIDPKDFEPIFAAFATHKMVEVKPIDNTLTTYKL